MAGIPGDPLSAFAGGLGGGLGKGLGDAIGGGGPMVSGGTTDARSGMDGSGWTVTTGGSRATGATRGSGGLDMSGQPSMPIGQASMAGFSGLPMLLMAGLFVYFLARGGKL